MKLKGWTKNTTWKYLVCLCLREKFMLQNKKLQSLKSFCSKAKKNTRQLPPALDSILKSWYVRWRLTWTIFSPQKDRCPPEAIEENAIKSEKFRDIYDFYRLLKVQKHAKRSARPDTKKGKLLRRRLRKPLKVGERVLNLAGRLKKKRLLQSIYISQQQRAFHSLTASKYLWSVKSLKLPKIINYIGFQKKATIR